jgi:hypothetical protein
MIYRAPRKGISQRPRRQEGFFLTSLNASHLCQQLKLLSPAIELACCSDISLLAPMSSLNTRDTELPSLNSGDTDASLQPGSETSKKKKQPILVSYNVNPEATENADLPYRVSLATTLSKAGFQNLRAQNRSLALDIVCLSETPSVAKNQRTSRRNERPEWTGCDPTDMFKSRVEQLVGNTDATGLKLVDDKTLKSVCLDNEDGTKPGEYRPIKVEEIDKLLYKLHKLDPKAVEQTPEFRADKTFVPKDW